jgi:hypothetical protein
MTTGNGTGDPPTLFSRFRAAFRHAFAVPTGADWTEEERAFVDRVARLVVERRLDFAAELWLESHAPLAWSAAQTLHMVAPIFAGVGREREAERLARFLEKPGAVELLLEGIATNRRNLKAKS